MERVIVILQNSIGKIEDKIDRTLHDVIELKTTVKHTNDELSKNTAAFKKLYNEFDAHVNEFRHHMDDEKEYMAARLKDEFKKHTDTCHGEDEKAVIRAYQETTTLMSFTKKMWGPVVGIAGALWMLFTFLQSAGLFKIKIG